MLGFIFALIMVGIIIYLDNKNVKLNSKLEGAKIREENLIKDLDHMMTLRDHWLRQYMGLLEEAEQNKPHVLTKPEEEFLRGK